MENLYWEITPYGRNLTDEELGYIFYENKLQGVARLRQVKVRNNSCTVQEDFKNIITSCYSVYSSASQMKETFGANGAEWVEIVLCANYERNLSLSWIGFYIIFNKYLLKLLMYVCITQGSHCQSRHVHVG